MAIMAVIVTGFIGGFNLLSKLITATRNKSLATRSARNGLAEFQGMPYHRVYASAIPIAVPHVSPTAYHDPAHYPPIVEHYNNVTFTRYAFVDKLLKNGATDLFQPVAANAPDTGLKRVAQTVVWQDPSGDWRNVGLKGLISNPNRQTNSVQFTGSIVSGLGVALPNTVVDVIQNPTWQARSDGAGAYAISLIPGTYSLRARKHGFFSQVIANQTVDFGNTPLSVHFTLPPMDSGTIKGTVWANDHLVISRIVGNAGGHEFVEIYNPTTFTWQMNNTQIKLSFQRRTVQDPSPVPIDINFISPSVASHHFYLFANANPTFNGVPADAVWDTGGPNTIALNARHPALPFNVIPTYEDGISGLYQEGAGGLILEDQNRGVLDTVGWHGGGDACPPDPGFSPDPNAMEGPPLGLSDCKGLKSGEEFDRYSSTHPIVNVADGPAYDSGDNEADWIRHLVPLTPRNTSNQLAPIAGTPGIGAFIFANDGLSASTQAVQTIVDAGPYAAFSLPNVATGSWTFSVSLGTLHQEGPVTIPFNGVTVTTTVFLTQSSNKGFLSGQVTDLSTSLPLAGITLTAGANSFITAGDGRFRAAVDPGAYTLTANPGGLNSLFTEQALPVNVLLGQELAGQDFQLSGAGFLSGCVTADGINPLPDINVQIFPLFTNMVQGEALSQSDCHFSVRVPTGTYTVQPALDVEESATPAQFSPVTLTAGSTLFVGTFTVTLAYGFIEGVVTKGGHPITTGVPIHASTNGGLVNGGWPGVMNSLNHYSVNQVYMTVSDNNGNYRLRALAATGYHVFGYYTTFNGNAPTTTSQGVAGTVNVSTTAPVTVNLNWP
jgi:hypothetical protein